MLCFNHIKSSHCIHEWKLILQHFSSMGMVQDPTGTILIINHMHSKTALDSAFVIMSATHWSDKQCKTEMSPFWTCSWQEWKWTLMFFVWSLNFGFFDKSNALQLSSNTTKNNFYRKPISVNKWWSYMHSLAAPTQSNVLCFSRQLCLCWLLLAAPTNTTRPRWKTVPDGEWYLNHQHYSCQHNHSILLHYNTYQK